MLVGAVPPAGVSRLRGMAISRLLPSADSEAVSGVELTRFCAAAPV